MRKFFPILTILLLAFSGQQSQADLILNGVVDGDLPLGLPKAVIIGVTNDVADLSDWGAGSANNGGGSDGVETVFSGSASAGDVIIVTSAAASTAFFADNYTDDFIFFEGSAAFINGDDAVELFNNVNTAASVFDVYGDPDTNGDGESWDYTDGYAVRISGSATTVFNQPDWNSVFQGLDGQDEGQHVVTIGNAFGFTPVPEPTSLLVLGVAGVGLILRRNR